MPSQFSNVIHFSSIQKRAPNYGAENSRKVQHQKTSSSYSFRSCCKLAIVYLCDIVEIEEKRSAHARNDANSVNWRVSGPGTESGSVEVGHM